ncbi:MAG: hypothetical protein WAQ08_10845 [Aquabacterium sp.]|uniref:hypothetical protein n=1 Tax=Aquabacterium sp. TaxID=1872578 RepID=UPI003BB1FFB4
MAHETGRSGVFDLVGYTSMARLRELVTWLRCDYARQGRDPRLIRADVLAYARDQGRLNSFAFGDLLRLHINRLLVKAWCARLGVVNDEDPDDVTCEQLMASRVTGAIFQACKDRHKHVQEDFPQVRWSPFKPIASVRCWSADNLVVVLRSRAH